MNVPFGSSERVKSELTKTFFKACACKAKEDF